MTLQLSSVHPLPGAALSPAAGPDHADDETLLCRAIVALSAVRQVARKLLSADHKLWHDAAAVDVLTTYYLDSFSPLLPSRHAGLDTTLRLMQQPLGGRLVAAVRGAKNVAGALHGAFRAVLIGAVPALDRIRDAHWECPDCELCKRICGQVAALGLYRDCTEDGCHADIDGGVFGAENFERGNRLAARMGPEQLEEILVRFARLAA
jgi:hypothetical protein